MFTCERCGAAFGPIQAAVLEFCPRCRARDRVSVPLISRRVANPAPPRTEPPRKRADRKVV